MGESIEELHSKYSQAVGLECGSFYIDSVTHAPYPCSCGFFPKPRVRRAYAYEGWAGSVPPPGGYSDEGPADG